MRSILLILAAAVLITHFSLPTGWESEDNRAYESALMGVLIQIGAISSCVLGAILCLPRRK